jgi:hypothetical protein
MTLMIMVDDDVLMVMKKLFASTPASFQNSTVNPLQYVLL